MRLPKFEHLQPESLEEALGLLSEYGEEVKVIAGGTDLLVSMKHRLLTPKYLLNLKGLAELDFIEDGKEGLRIGALTRLTTLIKSALVREKFPVLAQAASYVSAPPLRNMGTLGGNLCLNTRCFFYNQSQFWRQARPLCFKTGGGTCHVVKGGDHCYSVYQGDLAPVLIALEARVKLAKKGGERVIPLLDLYTDRGEEPIALEAGEILTEVEIPRPAPDNKSGRSSLTTASWGGDYQKLRYRGAMDFPLVGVAAVLNWNGGSCARARVVLTAVASAPVVVEEASKLLEGQKPDEEAISRAAEVAYEMAHPVANVGSTPLYRRKMVRVMTKRAIANAVRISESANHGS
jgi:4-hydroxybenzoyl-CoA reductase subunit beta